MRFGYWETIRKVLQKCNPLLVVVITKKNNPLKTFLEKVVRFQKTDLKILEKKVVTFQEKLGTPLDPFKDPRGSLDSTLGTINCCLWLHHTVINLIWYPCYSKISSVVFLTAASQLTAPTLVCVCL